ncbi:MAG TPA: SRPBCC family protein [Bacteroidia bacterium]|nr:SRPBCC family protein [Bacteroidia bacterium]
MENDITVTAVINAPIEKVWEGWTKPEAIKNWNAASADWHTPSAKNDLRPGGRFVYRMEAKDGSLGFDFSGKYYSVLPGELLLFKLDDNRDVSVLFETSGNQTVITEKFEAESQHSKELQQQGWQAILDNFKKYIESL